MATLSQIDRALDLLERWIVVKEKQPVVSVPSVWTPDSSSIVPYELTVSPPYWKTLGFGPFKNSRVVKVIRDTKIRTDPSYNDDGFPIFEKRVPYVIIDKGTLVQVHREYQYGDGRNNLHMGRNTGWEIIGEVDNTDWISYPRNVDKMNARYFLDFYDCEEVAGTVQR